MSKHYNIAFVGIGSIGRRHLTNVETYLKQRGDTCAIDLYRSSIKDDVDAHYQQYLYAEALPEDRQYDIVFVTNPSSMHEEAIRKFEHHTKAFFIEKPVFDSTEVDNAWLQGIKATCYVACPLRYNAVLAYLKESGLHQSAIAVRAICSSYLPDWRPNTDYRKCYSAHREMGGGVAIDLIHEWDYLSWLWGLPEKCYSIQDKVSNLEIDSDDIAVYIAKYPKMTIELHLDYLGRVPMRQLQIFTSDDTIVCDILNGTIEYLKSGERRTFDTERNAFQMREISHFFDIVDGKIASDNDIAHSLNVLRLAKGENQ